VEQGYGVCGTRDERPHTGQQQQLVDQVGHDGPSQEWLRQNHNWEQDRWFRDGIFFIAGWGASVRGHTAGCTAGKRSFDHLVGSVGGVVRHGLLTITIGECREGHHVEAREH
jgi:hypothetical protein